MGTCERAPAGRLKISREHTFLQQHLPPPPTPKPRHLLPDPLQGTAGVRSQRGVLYRRFRGVSHQTPLELPGNHGLPTDYACGYFYTPGILRHRYDDFMWRSSKSVVRKVMQEFAPDALLEAIGSALRRHCSPPVCKRDWRSRRHHRGRIRCPDSSKRRSRSRQKKSYPLCRIPMPCSP